MGTRDRTKMENALGAPPYMRRWAKDVNDAIESDEGFVTTTTAAPTTTTTTV